MSFVFVVGVVALTACSPSFGVPEGTLVACETDADCPADVPVCAVTRLCVSRALVGEDGPTLIRATPTGPTTIVVEYDLQGLVATLSWSGRAAATRYIVELSRAPDFASLAREPIAVDAPATSVDVDVGADGTYYWRVASDVQAQDTVMTPRALHFFEDSVYASCPDGTGACTGGFGTREQPARTIASALVLAETLGIENVLVAGRPQPYRESLLVRRPQAIVCGFDTAFTESNPTAYPTTIESINAGGALFIASVPSMHIRNCGFAGSQGAAAVNVVGSDNVSFQRVTIRATALDDIAGMSLLDSTVQAQDSLIALETTASAPVDRSNAGQVAVVRMNRSELTLIDSEARGALAYDPIGIDVQNGYLRLEGTLVSTGDRLGVPTPAGAAVGISARAAVVETYASRIFVGAGFASSYGIRANTGTQLVLDATIVASASTPLGSGYGVLIDGNTESRIVNSVLSGGLGGDVQAINAHVVVGYLTVFHSLLLNPSGSASPVVMLRSDVVPGPTCAPYSFAFVNNIFAASSAGLGNIIVAGGVEDDADDGTLMLNNALVTTSPGNAIAYSDTSTGDPSVLGCPGDSQGNLFLNRTIGQVFTNLAGPDGMLATLADNDQRPSDPADRAAMRAGTQTTGTCAQQACIVVTQDLAGAPRTTSPPSVGPYDLP